MQTTFNLHQPGRCVTITCAGGISSFSRVPCNDLVIKPSWVGLGAAQARCRATTRRCTGWSKSTSPERAKASPRSAASALCSFRRKTTDTTYTNAPCTSWPTASLPRGGERGIIDRGGPDCRTFPVFLTFLTRFPPLQLQRLQIGTCEELQCCRSTIANTPKDLMCLQSAIAEPCLQLQEAPHCNFRGSAAIRVWKCTLQTPRPTREIIVHTSWMQGGA